MKLFDDIMVNNQQNQQLFMQQSTQQPLTKQQIFKSDLQSPHLLQFQHLLLSEFNNDQPFQNQQINKVFRQLEIIKYDTQTAGGCSIAMALTGKQFPTLMMQTERKKKFKGIRQKKIEELGVVLDNFQFNESNNPISVIKENSDDLKKKYQIAEQSVFNYKNKQTTNQLLYHLLIKPRENRRECIKRLGIRKVEFEGKDKKVVELKKIEVQHLIGGSKRYCYCYLYPRDPQNQINSFYAILVQSYVEAKQAQTKSYNDFVKEGFVVSENKHDSEDLSQQNNDESSQSSIPWYYNQTIEKDKVVQSPTTSVIQPIPIKSEPPTPTIADDNKISRVQQNWRQTGTIRSWALKLYLFGIVASPLISKISAPVPWLSQFIFSSHMMVGHYLLYCL